MPAIRWKIALIAVWRHVLIAARASRMRRFASTASTLAPWWWPRMPKPFTSPLALIEARLTDVEENPHYTQMIVDLTDLRWMVDQLIAAALVCDAVQAFQSGRAGTT